MTDIDKKREEIREELVRVQCIYWCCADEELYADLKEDLGGLADKMMVCLHENDVAIKVDMHEGAFAIFGNKPSGVVVTIRDVKQAGYVAVEPLIKEK